MQIKNFIDEIERNKVLIIKIWISDKYSKKLISKYSIDTNLLIKKFAISTIEYFIKISFYEDTKSLIFEEFLKYLKILKIKSNEIFLLFYGLKNSLEEVFFNKEIDLILLKEINSYFEIFFSSILDIYSNISLKIKPFFNESINIVDEYVIISRTDTKGIITSVSSAFCEISGYRANELIGKSHNLIRHPDMPSHLFFDLWNTIQSGKMWQGDIKNLKKNGEYYWVKTKIHPIFDENGTIISYDAIREDITPQIELKKQQSILQEQSKSAAMGEMISMIAHQWRQPLQAVSILIQKLPVLKMIDGKISDEMMDDVVSQVNVQLEYMSKTIDDFRDYFKPNKKKEKIYIEKVITKSLNFLSYLFKINSIIIKYENSSTSKVEIYLNEMVQVFINLVKNSCDAMIENNIENRAINIFTYEKDEKLFIEFEDNAGGIKIDVIDKIFDPYFSTKSNKNGTGLGLYMSKTIIEQHSSGKIDAYNTKLGTKFIIELPLK
uniref:PAS domain-containing sensor histidine kinase n=1 Tax=Aliarcobacter sp. TaxID=2321116 RepID=UPI00404708D5